MNSVEYVTIVAGLPRSGTSMMMRMLVGGGMDVLTDDVRQADIDNLNGYFELEAVKKLREDSSWVGGACGKAVKMVYKLLYDLPPEFEYRVLLMCRDLGEVIMSQNKMLERHGYTGESAVDQRVVATLFRKELHQLDEWLANQPNFRTLKVDYNRLVEHPSEQLAAVNEFLGGWLDVTVMAKIVDPSMYRNRR